MLADRVEHIMVQQADTRYKMGDPSCNTLLVRITKEGTDSAHLWWAVKTRKKDGFPLWVHHKMGGQKKKDPVF